MATTNTKVLSGNTIKVVFNNTSIGLIQSVRASDNYGLQPASGIGDIHVQEYVPSEAMHTLSVQSMVLSQGNMRAAGIATINGEEALKGVVVDIIVFGPNNQELRKYTSCSYDSGDLEISAHKIVSSSCQFKALDVSGKGA